MRVRDSLTGEMRPLEPGDDGSIGMYVCGPTVYNRIHVGNARPFVVFQLMKRYLEWRGEPVTLVENITDINDKIYDAARRLDRPSDELAAEMSRAYIEDTGRLGIGRPDREPLASETLPEIVALIEELIADGHAYEAGGDVYFAVRSFSEYGRLSGRNPDEQLEGARVDPGEHKRDPLDFVLWKANKPDEDTAWDSPWGRGRPGWHIECSAMSERWLGREFSLHGGGRDLIFPHHENEVAQSRAAGRPFAQVWAHNGMLRLAGEKMSKSLGNIDPLHEVLDRWGAETLLVFFLRAHYASPVDYTDDALEQAKATSETLRNRMRDGGDGRDPRLEAAVVEALDDDFNTPRALALLFD
ncbi:MAG: cysteinyl-tRNA synthetase, partial [Gaiellales bacterium]|nr:cysteinyl-tRNA synthetase [Gaiellales bacterium]